MDPAWHFFSLTLLFSHQKSNCGVISEKVCRGQQRWVTLAAARCIPQFRWSCTISTLQCTASCTLCFSNSVLKSIAGFILLNNSAAHCPLRLVTDLYCRKLADNAWLHVTDKTKLCFLPHTQNWPITNIQIKILWVSFFFVLFPSSSPFSCMFV